jgi:transposase
MLEKITAAALWSSYLAARDDRARRRRLSLSRPSGRCCSEVRRARFGIPDKRTHDYVRHGTTTLFAALEVTTGKITDACYPRHRHEEFLRFLRQVARPYPRIRLHIVVDNYATHKHPDVTAWLDKNSRITLHFTPTSGLWLNMVEIFFGIITRQAIRRGSFTSVKDLITAIEAFTDGWNDRCQPFTWTKTPTSYSRAANPVKNLIHASLDTGFPNIFCSRERGGGAGANRGTAGRRAAASRDQAEVGRQDRRLRCRGPSHRLGQE